MEGPSSDLVRAADMLYAMDELDLVLTFVSDLAESSSDVVMLSALGELTARRNDAQAMLVLGKTALARGLTMERYAFPEIGVPAYSPIAPQSIGAWSIRLCAPRALLTSATLRQPMPLG